MKKKLKKLTNIEFIEKAKTIFPNYNYSKTLYIKARKKCIFTCPVHGDFYQYPDNLLHGHGCPKCGIEKRASKRRSSKEEFIKKANLIHNNKYDYNSIDYKNALTKVKIYCKHCKKYFYQTPNKHLSGRGCPYCKNERSAKSNTFTTEQFIEKARLIHGDKYDYSLTNYINIRTKVKIICPIHGVFEQIPDVHLSGCGCQKCNSSIGEEKIRNCLEDKNIKYICQKKFNDLKDKNKLSYDFYLKDYNLLIEYNGIQHYEPREYFGGHKNFLIQKHHDWLKRKYARDNNINLLVIPYWENIEEKLNECISI